MRDFLSYCEFANGWIAIDVDEGHGRWLASLALSKGRKHFEKIKSVEEWGL